MKGALLVLLGVGVGALVASYAINPSSCCRTVQGGVRDKVGDELGPLAQLFGDKLGLWKWTSGLASWFAPKGAV